MRAQIEQAVELLKAQDPQSAEKALELLQQTVFNFSMRACGHREDAEDTMQEVLMKSLPYLPRFDSPQALTVWLYKVAKNNCLMKRRRSKFAPKEHLSLEELMPTGDELAALSSGKEVTPEALVLKGEDADLLRKAILQVPPQYRLILILHDMEGLDSSEIAKITDLREGTVRVRLHRARLAVRKELAKLYSPKISSRKAHREGKPRRCRELFAALSDYMDGALDDSMCDQLENHLHGCVPCESFLSSLERTVEQCRNLNGGCKSQTANRSRKKLLEEYKKVLKALAPTGKSSNTGA